MRTHFAEPAAIMADGFDTAADRGLFSALAAAWAFMQVWPVHAPATAALDARARA